jgi:phosphonate transport system permease protein
MSASAQDQRITFEEREKQKAKIEQVREELLRPFPKPSFGGIATIIIVIAVLVWSNAGAQASPQEFVRGVPTLVNFVLNLLPAEFEYAEGTEYAINVRGFSTRPVEVVPKAERARRASAEDIAAMTDTQTLAYVYRETGASDASIITPEEAALIDAEEAHTLRPYIADEGFEIVLDDWDESVMLVEEGKRAVNAVPYVDGERVVARRYILNQGEFLIGYPIIIGSIIETVQMAIIGTVATIILSIPLALLAARNISPHPLVYQGTRLFLNLIRTIPPLIWALIMVSAVGLGPFAGVMALVIGSIGSNSRLYAESFEQIDPDQVAAVRATGANELQVFNFAVLPQAFPLLASYSLITFEVNVRASTILGLVGAGGVGFIIQKYTALFQFQRLMGAVLILMVVVTLIDRISDQIRKRII